MMEKQGDQVLDFRDMDYMIKFPYLVIMSLLPMGYHPKNGMDYGLWVMVTKFPHTNMGNQKNVWVMRVYVISMILPSQLRTW